MNETIFATFSDPDLARKAAGALLDHGIRSEHLSIVFPSGYVAKEGGKAETSTDAENSAERGITTTTAEDAKSGAATGAGIGLGAGALMALASIFVPGFGLVVGGGALAIALGGLAGSTAAGAVAGGVTGYLKDQGVPEAAAESYANVLAGGGAVVGVSPTDEKVETMTIESVLAKYGGTISRHALKTSPASLR